MDLRKIKPEEFGQLLFEIDNAAFTREFDLRARNIQEEVDYLKNSEVFLAYDDNRAVGLIGYQLESDKAEIKTLAVIPEYQNKGIGKQMMTEILSKLKGKKVNLVTHPKNTSAIILYLKSGFKIYGWKDNYYGDGEPRLMFEQTL